MVGLGVAINDRLDLAAASAPGHQRRGQAPVRVIEEKQNAAIRN